MSNQSTISFEDAKNEKHEIELLVSNSEKVLKQFPVGPLGLVPDSIRITAEYRKANADFNFAFKKLQGFNRWFCKQFKADIRREHTQKYR